MNFVFDNILKYILRMNDSFLIYNNSSSGRWEDQRWPSVILSFFLFFFVSKKCRRHTKTLLFFVVVFKSLNEAKVSLRHWR